MNTSTSSPASFRRILAAAAAAVALTAGSLLLAAAPASAHDELLSTDPAADSSVEALPEQLTLTFSGQLLGEAGASEVQATDAAGTALTDGAPIVTDNVITQPLTGTASGAVTVLWRTVSSDGHPISGEFTFTVTAAPSPTASESPSATPTEETTPSESPSPQESLISPPADEPSSFSDVWPWVIGGILIVGLGGAVVYLLVSRARREKALAGGAVDGSENDSADGAPDGAGTASPGTPPTGSEPPAER